MSDAAIQLFESLDDSFFDDHHNRERVRPNFVAAYDAPKPTGGAHLEVQAFWTAGGLAKRTVIASYGRPHFFIPPGHAMDAEWRVDRIGERLVGGSSAAEITQPEYMALRREREG